MSGVECFEVKWVSLMWLILKDGMLSQRRICTSILRNIQFIYFDSDLPLCLQGTSMRTIKPAARKERQHPGVLRVVRLRSVEWRSLPASKECLFYDHQVPLSLSCQRLIAVSDSWLSTWLWFLFPLRLSSELLPCLTTPVLWQHLTLCLPFCPEKSLYFRNSASPIDDNAKLL